MFRAILLTTAILLTLSLLFSGNSFGTITLLDEDYNSLTDGQALPGWTSGVYAQDDEFVSASMGAAINDDYPRTYTTIPLTQGQITFEIWMKPGVGYLNNNFYIGNIAPTETSGGNHYYPFWRSTDDWWHYQYLSPGGQHIIQNIAPHVNGKWYHFRLIYYTPTNTYDLYMDTVQVADDVKWLYDLSAGILNVGLSSGWANSGLPSYFDDLKISAEPIPEPSTILSLTAGLVGMASYSGVKFRRKRKV